ncbi:MAG: hypothetical protein ACR2GO_04825 [Candidatus Limnocylindria bacterium]
MGSERPATSTVTVRAGNPPAYVTLNVTDVSVVAEVGDVCGALRLFGPAANAGDGTPQSTVAIARMMKAWTRISRIPRELAPAAG